jgi:hypothetical protein
MVDRSMAEEVGGKVCPVNIMDRRNMRNIHYIRH